MSGPKKWHRGRFPGFYFLLIFPQLGAEQVSNLKTPMVTDKKKFQQMSALSRLKERASLQDRKFLQNNTLVKHYLK
jgi:hypothetical protein